MVQTLIEVLTELGRVVGMLAVMVAAAGLIEAVIEMVLGEILNHIPKLEPYKWLLRYVAYGVGIYAAFLYSFDLLYFLGQFLTKILDLAEPLPVPLTGFGIVMTGAGIGRGAQFLHDYISKYFTKPTIPAA